MPSLTIHSSTANQAPEYPQALAPTALLLGCFDPGIALPLFIPVFWLSMSGKGANPTQDIRISGARTPNRLMVPSNSAWQRVVFEQQVRGST